MSDMTVHEWQTRNEKEGIANRRDDQGEDLTNPFLRLRDKNHKTSEKHDKFLELFFRSKPLFENENIVSNPGNPKTRPARAV